MSDEDPKTDEDPDTLKFVPMDGDKIQEMAADAVPAPPTAEEMAALNGEHVNSGNMLVFGNRFLLLNKMNIMLRAPGNPNGTLLKNLQTMANVLDSLNSDPAMCPDDD